MGTGGARNLELELDRELVRARLSHALFGHARKPVQLGRFTLVRRIGQGAMGTVYEAHDPERGARIALKVLTCIDARGVYRLKQEFRTLAQLSHPNLLALDELFCEQGAWFFSMELITNATPFDAWVRPRAGAVDRLRLHAALMQVIAAVHAVHQSGKLHGDLKPTNVLVTPEGRVVVLDLGLVSDVAGGNAAAWRAGELIGTPAYLAPEQAAGQPASAASDWYAVGVMLYQALTSTLPFAGGPGELLRVKQLAAAPSARDGYGCGDSLLPLCDVCDALLSRDPHARPDYAQLLSAVQSPILEPDAGAKVAGPSIAAQGPRAAPFVGREAELATLAAAQREAQTGAVQIVLIGGPSGSGKSRLLEQFCLQLNGDPLVLRGRCHEHESVPYKVFDAVMDALAAHLARLGQEQALALLPRGTGALLRLFPALGRVDAFARNAAVVQGRESRALRDEAFAALKELLWRVSQRSPVVIVVDDLQWGDADSTSMLRHVLGAPQAPSLLFLGAYRNEDASRSQLLGELLDESGAERPRLVQLGPLPEPAAIELVHALSAAENLRVDDHVARSVIAESGGMPFLIEELVRHHRERSKDGTLEANGVPITLERAILERLASLPLHAQYLLRVLSVAVAPIEQRAAITAAGLSSDDRSALYELRRARFVKARGGGPLDAIETYHDRIREIVAQQLDVASARAIHGRLAAVLEQQGAIDSERIVAHYVGAGDNARASEQAAQAAAAAAAKLAFNRAAELLRTAIQLAGDPDAAARAELYERLADALVNAGRSAEAAETFVRMAGMTTGAQSRRMLRCAAQHYLRSGRTEQGLALAREVFSALDLALPESGARAAGAWLWQRARLAATKLELAQPSIEPDLRQRERLECLGAVFPNLSIADPICGAALQTQCLREALRSGEPVSALQGLVWEAFNLVLLGGTRNQRRAQRALALAHEIAGRLDTPHARSMVALGEASLHCWGGASFRSALAPAALAERGFAELGSAAAWERGVAAFVHFTSLEFTGPLSELSTRAMELLREAKDRDDRFILMLMLLSVPYGLVARGEADAALALLLDHEGAQGAGYTTFRHVWNARMTETLIYLGRGDEALDLLDAQWPGFLRSSHHRSPFGRGSGYYYRARAALVAYKARRNPALLRRVLHDCDRLRGAPPVYHCFGVLLRMAVDWERGSHAGIDDRLQRAAAELRSVGADALSQYANLARAKLAGDHAASTAIVRDLGAQGIHDPERWAWCTLPIGPGPTPSS